MLYSYRTLSGAVYKVTIEISENEYKMFQLRDLHLYAFWNLVLYTDFMCVTGYHLKGSTSFDGATYKSRKEYHISKTQARQRLAQATWAARARLECTSSLMLGGNAAKFCLCCRPTHSPTPSVSPIRTTSSIRCGAGIVGYWRDWPGEWHSPVILKLTIEGVRPCLLTAGSWSQHPQPHRCGSTVGGGSPR